MKRTRPSGGAVGLAATDADPWPRVAELVSRLGCFDREAREAANDALDIYLAFHKLSWYDLADRVMQRPDPWAVRITPDNIMDLYKQ
jgi:hypothetical protein